jgi:hypothetical protein
MIVMPPIPREEQQRIAMLEQVFQQIADALSEIDRKIDALDERVTALEP